MKYQVVTMTHHGDHSRVLITEGFENYATAQRRLKQVRRSDAEHVSEHTMFTSTIVKNGKS